MSLPIEEEEIQRLVRMYAQAAAQYAAATKAGDPEAVNKAYAVIAAVYRELRRRGVSAQRELLPLLDSTDPGVRGWAASHALEFAPGDAEPVLVAMSGEATSIFAFDAKMTLQEWRAGKLRFP